VVVQAFCSPLHIPAINIPPMYRQRFTAAEQLAIFVNG
jgi:hypothetical protein